MRFRFWLMASVAVMFTGACGRDRQESALERLQQQNYGFVIDDFLRAAKAGDEAAVRDFLTGGMVVDVADREGQTPFQQAAQEAHARVAIVLLEHGADPNQRLRDGGTALIEAVRQASCNLRYVDELLRRGADARRADGNGLTALMTAALRGHVEAVRLLVARDTAASRDRALLLASAGGHTACMDLLLDHGAYVNCRSRDGRTPLMFALVKGHREAALLLLQREANRFALDGAGMTAADLADRGGLKDLATILRSMPALRQGRTAVHDDLDAPGLENLHGQVLALGERNDSSTEEHDDREQEGFADAEARLRGQVRLGSYHEAAFPLVLLGVEAVEKEEKAEPTAVMRLLTEPRATEPLRLAVGDTLPIGVSSLVVTGIEEEAEKTPRVLAENVETGESFVFLPDRLTEASPAYLIVEIGAERRPLAAYAGDEFAVTESRRRYRVEEVKPHALVLADVEAERELVIARP